MDNSIRKNTHCIIGLPRCDFVFSSTRTCFIAYGFKQSTMEMEILKGILKEKGIHTEEASGNLSPGQNAFCAKICSKIITSQFCIVLINDDEIDGKPIPNANVNMEYGLMLGFNKFVIPLQKETHTLPFNVAGLDTIKYNGQTLRNRASEAIDKAISETTQKNEVVQTNQFFDLFILSKNAVLAPLFEQGEKEYSNLGKNIGFILLNTFSGDTIIYLGIFTSLRPEIVVWRIRKLVDLLTGRHSSIEVKAQIGLITPLQASIAISIFQNLEIWVIVTSDEEKSVIEKQLGEIKPFKCHLFSLNDVENEIASIR